MSAPESLRDEVAAVLAEYDACGVAYESEAWRFECGYVHAAPLAGAFEATLLHLADALLASPALARVIREAKAEAWDEGLEAGRVWAEVDGRWPASPYRDEQVEGVVDDE